MAGTLLRLISVFALCLVVVHALDSLHSYVVHERRDALHPSWVKSDRVGGDVSLLVRIGLKHTDMGRAHEVLMEVSDPSSAKYGEHWTQEKVIEAFRPSDRSVKAVRQWLSEAGVSEVSHSGNKGWLAFYATAHQLEDLLHTEYHEYAHSSGNVFPACEQYHVPKHIQEHIDFITPGINLAMPVDQLSRRSDKANRRPSTLYRRSEATRGAPSARAADISTCDLTMTPACIAALYKIPLATLASPENSMGIFEAELQMYDQEDLNLFFSNYTSIPNGTHPILDLIDGGVGVTTNISEAGPEALLDTEMAYPIVYPQAITIFNVDDLNFQAEPNDTYTWGFNALLDAIDGSYCTYSAYGETGDAPGIDPTYPDQAPGGYKGSLQCGVYKPTNVISLSYGGREAEVSIAYQKRQCNEFLKLGLQGVTVIFASGDSGVANLPLDFGGGPGLNGCLGPNDNIFNPTWPNNCPYVTVVGATKIPPGGTISSPEVAAMDAASPSGQPYPFNFSSGGGFSNLYPVPKYQARAVKEYFDRHSPPYPSYSGLSPDAPLPALPNITALAGSTGGIYNRIGRGIPDVAAIGDDVAFVFQGQFGNGFGTSASAPIFGGIINRINEERIAAGKGTVGFINPALYANPWVLNDITSGTNPGCGTIGFEAVEGWDPVTGLGSPNYPKMLDLFMRLPCEDGRWPSA